MVEAIWIVVSRMVIIFAVMGLLFLAITIMNRLARPREKTSEKK